jgi:thermitase
VADLQPEYGTALLNVPAGEEAAEIARLRNLPGVMYAELNYIVHAAADAAYPDDPAFGEQWHMRRVYAPEAWAVTYGSSTLVVAVLDSGVDRNHPEFYRQFHDPLLPGWDYINGDSNPNDDYGHGTHVTGLIAAATNNRLGVAGLAQNIKILPLKVLDASGAGDFYTVANAIRRAADFSAQVVNLSLGGLVQYPEQQTLQSAVDYALARNALVVAAAGNCAQGGAGCGYPNPMFYPAACDGVLAVAASDHFDNWAPYSNYKPYVSLAAPGGLTDDALLSTVPGGGYGFKYGTSMATALVTGAAALVWTLQPAASYQQVAGILKDTADKVGANPLTGQPLSYVNGRNDYFGYGRLNVGQAVRRAYPPTLIPITEVQTFVLGGSETQQTRLLALTNPGGQSVQWRATVVRGGVWLNVAPSNGSAAYGNPGVLTLQASSALLGPGLYFGTVRVEPQPGSTGFTSFDIEVQLHVSSVLRRAFLPVAARDWAAPEWFDPLSDPARQALGLTNDEVRQLRLPFPVTVYGVAQTRIGVSDNGLVLLGQPRVYQMNPPAGCLQTAAAPNDAIYALALDWRPDLGGQEVYVHQPDADTYVVTWSQIRRAGNPTPQTFQLVFRRNGQITASYQAVEAASPGIIGVENWDGTVAQQIRCEGKGRIVRSGDSVSFDPVLPW